MIEHFPYFPQENSWCKWFLFHWQQLVVISIDDQFRKVLKVCVGTIKSKYHHLAQISFFDLYINLEKFSNNRKKWSLSYAVSYLPLIMYTSVSYWCIFLVWLSVALYYTNFSWSEGGLHEICTVRNLPCPVVLCCLATLCLVFCCLATECFLLPPLDFLYSFVRAIFT